MPLVVSVYQVMNCLEPKGYQVLAYQVLLPDEVVLSPSPCRSLLVTLRPTGFLPRRSLHRPG